MLSSNCKQGKNSERGLSFHSIYTSFKSGMRTDGASMPVHMDGSSMSFQKWLSAVRIRPWSFKNGRPRPDRFNSRPWQTWTDMDGHGRSMLVHHGHGRTVVRGRSMPSVVHVIQNTKEVDSYNFWGKSTLVGNTKYGLMNRYKLSKVIIWIRNINSKSIKNKGLPPVSDGKTNWLKN